MGIILALVPGKPQKVKKVILTFFTFYAVIAVGTTKFAHDHFIGSLAPN